MKWEFVNIEHRTLNSERRTRNLSGEVGHSWLMATKKHEKARKANFTEANEGKEGGNGRQFLKEQMDC